MAEPIRRNEKRREAHFETPEAAWWFNLTHPHWRVTADVDETAVPDLYHQLDGHWCDPAAQRAQFGSFRAAWLFAHLHPDWCVTWVDPIINELDPDIYDVSPAGIKDLLERGW